MEKHKVLLGAIYIVFGAFTVVGSLFVMILITLNGGIVQEPHSLIEVLKIVGFVGSVILLLISIPGIIGGIGLIHHKSWAKSLVLIIGFFYLFFIPLGTFLSMYTVLVLMRDQIALLFTSPLSVSKREIYSMKYQS
ncbi:MAG: hypothetical protein M3512_10660 [Bacteroidota bacterium]|nr:hypothetical protein [Bacteroidota bacterium]